MRRVLARVLAILTVGGLVALVAATGRANSGLMAQLPLSAPVGCANCHSGATATTVPADHALNNFGVDFKNNGSVWNAALASLDSDADGCTNGSEVGDADGNGQPDANVSQENSNPGTADCTNGPIDETWGRLKSLFNSR